MLLSKVCTSNVLDFLIKYFIILYLDFQNILLYNRLRYSSLEIEVKNMETYRNYNREDFNKILSAKITKKLLRTATVLAALGILNKTF